MRPIPEIFDPRTEADCASTDSDASMPQQQQQQQNRCLRRHSPGVRSNGSTGRSSALRNARQICAVGLVGFVGLATSFVVRYPLAIPTPTLERHDEQTKPWAKQHHHNQYHRSRRRLPLTFMTPTSNPNATSEEFSVETPPTLQIYTNQSSIFSVDALSSLDSHSSSLMSPLGRLHAAIADLQLEFGSDAVALVRDDEMEDDDDEILETASDHAGDQDHTDGGEEDDASDVRPTINSLVFTIDVRGTDAVSSNVNQTSYVLVILRDIHRVNVTALEEAIQQSEWPLHSLFDRNTPQTSVSTVEATPNGSAQPISISLVLAPSHTVSRVCGFAPGSVPPVGLSPAPWCTVLDQSLVTHALEFTTMMVRGGGGRHDQSCLIAVDVLLQQPKVIVAPVALFKHDAYDCSPDCAPSRCCEDEPILLDDENAVNDVDSVTTPTSIEMVINDSTILARPKPFFAVAPPSDDVASNAMAVSGTPLGATDGASTTKLQPQSVTFVGRIASVRRMARGLVFCDAIPPDRAGALFQSSVANVDTNDDVDDYDDAIDPWPWRSPVDAKVMSVQLIAGKTLCQTTGSDEAIRRLQPGQLLLIHGRTNVGNRDSLRNWVNKRSLDIVIQSYQLLTESSVSVLNRVQVNGRHVASSEQLQRRGPSQPIPPVDPETCLRLKDLYVSDCEDTDSDASRVVLVDDMTSVRQFATDLSRLLLSLKSPMSNASPDMDGNGLQTVALVGIDCEWQPSFMLQTPRDPQPVLLLQICLHPLNRTYLFDLQTLLRPMMPPAQSMDKLEREVSSALGALFESKRLIKVGFQVVHDLRQCAASYPHIPTLHYYNSVLESSTLGKKAIRIAGSGDARIATSSLTRLVEQFIGKPLNKLEQCSDWANRPLSTTQIEYAALDAAVTPIMVLRMVEDLDAQFFWGKPQLGRWENDLSFKKVLTSWRFVFIHTTDFEVQRKLKAKRVVGEPLIVSQSWTTGDVPPRIPALPENGVDGPYTDVWGLIQVPSVIVTIRSNHIDNIIDSMIGERVGKSKDKCVESFLRRPDILPAGARLDYPQRSGFVEFRDGVALFVNMPSTPGGRFQPRSYPNEWYNDGRVLTWFLRENDWKQGTSELAKKLVSSPDHVVVTLFVRMGSTGAFLCCGRCRVQDPLSAVNVNGSRDYYGEATAPPDNWTLIKLHLVLLDWTKLRLNSDFQALLNPDVCLASDPYDKRLD